MYGPPSPPPKLFNLLGQSLRDMSSDNGKWHGGGTATSWKFPQLTPFLFLSFPVSLFSSLSFSFFRVASPSSFRSLPTISRYYIALSPLSGPVLRFRRYSSESGTPHVLQLFDDLGDFDGLSEILLFAILFFKSDRETVANMSTANFCPYKETSCRFWACTKARSWLQGPTLPCIEHGFFPLIKI